MHNFTVPIASDHRGFLLKTKVVAWLHERGHEVLDFGPNSENRCNASDYALKVADAIRQNPAMRGILICGTGQAMAMTANRFKHLRAALCVNSTMVKLARLHNDANILALGAHIIGQEIALDCVDCFLATEFLGGLYAERCAALTALGGIE